jgi:phosphate transport system protein
LTTHQENTKTRSSLDRDLASIRKEILVMGSRIDATIERSLQALRELDQQLARQIIADDTEVNNQRYKIEEMCLAVIARQQPAAGDLREILATMSIVTDLERMADHAAGIAKTVLQMGNESARSLPQGILRMADLGREMLRRTLEAYALRDSDLAYAVALQDDLIDTQYRALFREFLDRMNSKSASTDIHLYLLFSGHNLERIADRVTNIAERVIFMSSGEMMELNPEPGWTALT